MKNKILERPNGKYWTPEDIQELERVKTYKEMATIALRILERMPGPIMQICGPISTEGKGSKKENMKEFNKAIFFFHEQDENVFDQIPFQEAMTRLSKEVEGYDKRVLTDFYLPLFESGKVTTFKFLPGGKSSKGARWERRTIKRLRSEKSFPGKYKITGMRQQRSINHLNKKLGKKLRN